MESINTQYTTQYLNIPPIPQNTRLALEHQPIIPIILPLILSHININMRMTNINMCITNINMIRLR